MKDDQEVPLYPMDLQSLASIVLPVNVSPISVAGLVMRIYGRTNLAAAAFIPEPSRFSLRCREEEVEPNTNEANSSRCVRACMRSPIQ